MHRLRSFHDLPDYQRPAYFEYRANCPDCGEAMQNMGREFRPPKQGQYKVWKALQEEYWKKCQDIVMKVHQHNISISAKGS